MTRTGKAPGRLFLFFSLQMMNQNPDPFCAYSTTTDQSTEIFTVLPPVSLIDTQPLAERSPSAFSEDDFCLNTPPYDTKHESDNNITREEERRTSSDPPSYQ